VAMASAAKTWFALLGGGAILVAVLLAILASSGEPDPGAPVEPLREAPATPRSESAESQATGDLVAEAGDPEVPGSQESGPARTRRTDLVPLPLEDEIRIEVSRDGRITYGDKKAKAVKGGRYWEMIAQSRIVEELFVAADSFRDLENPSQPSTRNLLLDFDGDVPWWVLRVALSMPADPAVRIYRIHWSVLPEEGETRAGLPVFFPKDRGLAKTRVRLYGSPRPRVALIREVGDGATTVRFLGRDLGRGESGFAALKKRLPALYEELPESDLLIDPWPDVPVSDVVRALDLIPGELRAGNCMDLKGLEEIPGFSQTSEETVELLRAALQAWELEYDGDLLAEDGDLSAGFQGFLSARRTADEIVRLFERALARNAEDLPEIRKLLTNHEFTNRMVRQLGAKARLERGILLGLARGYLARRLDGDCLRAATLAGLVATASPRRQYTRSWWTCQFLVIRALFGRAERMEDRAPLSEGLTLVELLEKLAAVAKTPYTEELDALKEEAERVARWLR